MIHLKTFETYGNPDFLESIAKELYDISMYHINNIINKIADYDKYHGTVCYDSVKSYDFVFYEDSNICEKIKKYLKTDFTIKIQIQIIK